MYFFRFPKENSKTLKDSYGGFLLMRWVIKGSYSCRIIYIHVVCVYTIAPKEHIIRGYNKKVNIVLNDLYEIMYMHSF
jgi:hypothetical protein